MNWRERERRWKATGMRRMYLPLTDDDLALANRAASANQSKNRELKVNPDKIGNRFTEDGEPDFAALDSHQLAGIKAEIAVSRLLGVPFEISPGVYTKRDVGGCIEVRSSGASFPWLRVHDGDLKPRGKDKVVPLDFPFVCARATTEADDPRVSLFGWAWGRDLYAKAVRMTVWGTDGVNTRYLPPEFLEPMQGLAAVFEEIRRKAA